MPGAVSYLCRTHWAAVCAPRNIQLRGSVTQLQVKSGIDPGLGTAITGDSLYSGGSCPDPGRHSPAVSTDNIAPPGLNETGVPVEGNRHSKLARHAQYVAATNTFVIVVTNRSRIAVVAVGGEFIEPKVHDKPDLVHQ